MTRDELEKKHPLYENNLEDWNLYDLINESGKGLIEYALSRNPRESYKNWRRRIQNGCVFNFGKAIVEIFNFYLNEKEVIRVIPGLENDPIWAMFEKDADLQATNYDVFLDDAQKLASVFGVIGILVNKPGGDIATVKDAMNSRIYPYYSLYSPPNIYDWQWEKDPITHRRALAMIKLREEDNLYTIWYPSYWEQWRMDKQPVKIASGINPLEEIPFVWMPNLKNSKYPEIGISDLVDISRIVCSIARNVSTGDEMIDLAGFPIRRQPMKPEGFDDGDEEVGSGPSAVEEFDPTLGEAGKPDWMPTEILEPVEATLKWIDRKTDEIYRIAHMSGVHGQRKSNNEVASGLALRYEFGQLNKVMNAKALHQNEAELQLLRFWLKWQNKLDVFENVDIRRSREFSIDELAVALDNAITGMNNVLSKTFRERCQVKIADYILPDLSQDDKEAIRKEITVNTPETPEFNGEPTGSRHIVRSAHEARADHQDDG